MGSGGARKGKSREEEEEEEVGSGGARKGKSREEEEEETARRRKKRMTPKGEGGRKLELINKSTAAIAEVMLWEEVAHMKLSQRSLQDAPIFRLLLKVAVKGTHQCDYSNFWGSFGLPTEQQQQQTRTWSKVLVKLWNTHLARVPCSSRASCAACACDV